MSASDGIEYPFTVDVHIDGETTVYGGGVPDEIDDEAAFEARATIQSGVRPDITGGAPFVGSVTWESPRQWSACVWPGMFVNEPVGGDPEREAVVVDIQAFELRGEEDVGPYRMEFRDRNFIRTEPERGIGCDDWSLNTTDEIRSTVKETLGEVLDPDAISHREMVARVTYRWPDEVLDIQVLDPQFLADATATERDIVSTTGSDIPGALDYDFEVSVEQANKLKPAFEILQRVSSDTAITRTNSGLRFFGVNRANTTSHVVEAPRGVFDTFRVGAGTVWFDVDAVWEFVRQANFTDSLRLVGETPEYDEVRHLSGATISSREALEDAGFDTVESIRAATVDQLAEVEDIGQERARRIKRSWNTRLHVESDGERLTSSGVILDNPPEERADVDSILPDVSYDTTASMSGAEFEESLMAVKQALDGDNDAALVVGTRGPPSRGEGAYFHAVNDSDRYQEIHATPESNVGGRDVGGYYKFGPFNEIRKALARPSRSDVSIGWSGWGEEGSAKPIRVGYTIPNGDDIKVEVYVAPRIITSDVMGHENARALHDAVKDGIDMDDSRPVWGGFTQPEYARDLFNIFEPLDGGVEVRIGDAPATDHNSVITGIDSAATSKSSFSIRGGFWSNRVASTDPPFEKWGLPVEQMLPLVSRDVAGDRVSLRQFANSDGDVGLTVYGHDRFTYAVQAFEEGNYRQPRESIEELAEGIDFSATGNVGTAEFATLLSGVATGSPSPDASTENWQGEGSESFTLGVIDGQMYFAAQDDFGEAVWLADDTDLEGSSYAFFTTELLRNKVAPRAETWGDEFSVRLGWELPMTGASLVASGRAFYEWAVAPRVVSGTADDAPEFFERDLLEQLGVNIDPMVQGLREENIELRGLPEAPEAVEADDETPPDTEDRQDDTPQEDEPMPTTTVSPVINLRDGEAVVAFSGEGVEHIDTDTLSDVKARIESTVPASLLLVGESFGRVTIDDDELEEIDITPALDALPDPPTGTFDGDAYFIMRTNNEDDPELVVFDPRLSDIITDEPWVDDALSAAREAFFPEREDLLAVLATVVVDDGEVTNFIIGREEGGEAEEADDEEAAEQSRADRVRDELEERNPLSHNDAIGAVERAGHPIDLQEITGIGESTASRLEGVGVTDTVWLTLAAAYGPLPDPVAEVLENVAPRFRESIADETGDMREAIDSAADPDAQGGVEAGSDDEPRTPDEIEGHTFEAVTDTIETAVAGLFEAEVQHIGDEWVIELQRAPGAPERAFEGDPDYPIIDFDDVEETIERVIRNAEQALDMDALDFDQLADARQAARDMTGLTIPEVGEFVEVEQSQEDAPPEGAEEITGEEAPDGYFNNDVWNDVDEAIERQGTDASQLIGRAIEDVLLEDMGEYYDEAVVGIEGDGTGIGELRIGGVMHEQGRQRIAGSGIWGRPPAAGVVMGYASVAEASGGGEQPREAYRRLYELTKLLDVEEGQAPELHERLDTIDTASTFGFREGDIDIQKAFLRRQDLRPIVRRGAAHMWQNNIRAHMENVHPSYYVAQLGLECSEAIAERGPSMTPQRAAGQVFACGVLQPDAQDLPRIGTLEWFKEEAWQAIVDGEFDHLEYMADYFGISDRQDIGDTIISRAYGPRGRGLEGGARPGGISAEQLSDLRGTITEAQELLTEAEDLGVGGSRNTTGIRSALSDAQDALTEIESMDRDEVSVQLRERLEDAVDEIEEEIPDLQRVVDRRREEVGAPEPDEPEPEPEEPDGPPTVDAINEAIDTARMVQEEAEAEIERADDTFPDGLPNMVEGPYDSVESLIGSVDIMITETRGLSREEIERFDQLGDLQERADQLEEATMALQTAIDEAEDDAAPVDTDRAEAVLNMVDRRLSIARERNQEASDLGLGSRDAVQRLNSLIVDAEEVRTDLQNAERNDWADATTEMIERGSEIADDLLTTGSDVSLLIDEAEAEADDDEAVGISDSDLAGVRDTIREAQDLLDRAEELDVAETFTGEDMRDALLEARDAFEEMESVGPENVTADLRDRALGAVDEVEGLIPRLEELVDNRRDQLARQERRREERREEQRREVEQEREERRQERQDERAEDFPATGTYFVFITSGAVPTVGVSPNRSLTPAQTEGEPMAEAVQSEVRSAVVLGDQPRDEVIGVAEIENGELVELDIGTEEVVSEEPAPEAEPEPSPEEAEPSRERQRARTLEQLNVDTLTIEEADVERADVDEVNVSRVDVERQNILDRADDFEEGQ